MKPLEIAEKNHRDLQDRLGKLSAEIKARHIGEDQAETKRKREAGLSGDAGRAMSLGFRALSDLLAGIAVGGTIGWGLDRLLSTAPLMFILFLLAGTVAGVFGVMRTAGRPLSHPEKPANTETSSKSPHSEV